MNEQLRLFDHETELDDDVSQLESLISFPNQVDEALLRDAYGVATGCELFSAVRHELARILRCHASEVLPRLRKDKRDELMRERLGRHEKKPAGKVLPEPMSLFESCRK